MSINGVARNERHPRRLAAKTLFVVLAAVPLVFASLVAAPRDFELRGKVLDPEGKPLIRSQVILTISAVGFLFSKSIKIRGDGTYRFKGLKRGIYRINAAHPERGTVEVSVDIGPSTAGNDGRIEFDVQFAEGFDTGSVATISAYQLAVPKEAESKYEEAQKCLEKEDRDCAVAKLEAAVKIAPGFSRAWNHLGTIAFQESRFVDARKFFETALECAPDAYAPLVNLGAALIHVGKLDEALTTNRRAATRQPDDALAHSQLGLTLLFLNRLDEAAEALIKAKNLDPRHFSFPQLTLAEVYRKQGKPAALKRELEDFLEYHPDTETATRVRTYLAGLATSLKAKP